ARHPGQSWALQITGGRLFPQDRVSGALVWPCRGESRLLPAVASAPSALGENDAGADGSTRAAAATTVTAATTTTATTTTTGRTGVVWPLPRFVASAAVVADRLTGLLWRLDADAAGGPVTWTEALAAVGTVPVGPGLRWRLPTINELESLVDAAAHDPALPAGHPFRNAGDAYWSSTTSAFEPDWCMALYLDRGAVGVGQKSGRHFLVWPVAGPLASNVAVSPPAMW
ncbi:MAG: DUF1566 domain-containing protein, partial [Candidatus Krumholzibacteriia bacterium]